MIPNFECILDRDVAQEIIEQSVEVITQDGILFRQGQRGDCLYFVKWGEVTLTMLAGEKEIRLRAGKGSLLGIAALFGNQPHSMTAKTIWDAEIFSIGPRAFTGLLNRDLRIKENVLQVLAGEVRAIRRAFSQLI